MSQPGFRLAVDTDVAAMQAVERRAGALFRACGMDLVAGAEPATAAEISRYIHAGRAWVAVDGDDLPVGFLLVEVVDGAGHVEQVSVDPEHGRQGLGLALIGMACQWTRQAGMRRVTLTTFADVEWNGPYYERLGFQAMREQDVTPGLRQKRQHEADHGLDKWPRLCMQLTLRPDGGAAP